MFVSVLVCKEYYYSERIHFTKRSDNVQHGIPAITQRIVACAKITGNEFQNEGYRVQGGYSLYQHYETITEYVYRGWGGNLINTNILNSKVNKLSTKVYSTTLQVGIKTHYFYTFQR